MSVPIELVLFRSTKTGKGLIKLVHNLREGRRSVKNPGNKRQSLTKRQRQIVLNKTDSRCHICGVDLTLDKFQADHVRSRHGGGDHAENNYLASCATCNNYRWHYSSEEIQIILRLGVWAKTKIMNDPTFGLDLANRFLKHEMGVRKRRKARSK